MRPSYLQHTRWLPLKFMCLLITKEVDPSPAASLTCASHASTSDYTHVLKAEQITTSKDFDFNMRAFKWRPIY